MHATDYQSRTRRCPHPRDRIEQIAPNLRRCTACGRWSGTLDSEELMRLFYPPGVPRAEAQAVLDGRPWSDGLKAQRKALFDEYQRKLPK